MDNGLASFYACYRGADWGTLIASELTLREEISCFYSDFKDDRNESPDDFV